eukprot:10581240-Prorocentrum_lima.AAC.1
MTINYAALHSASGVPHLPTGRRVLAGGDHQVHPGKHGGGCDVSAGGKHVCVGLARRQWWAQFL